MNLRKPLAIKTVYSEGVSVGHISWWAKFHNLNYKEFIITQRCVARSDWLDLVRITVNDIRVRKTGCAK